MQLFSSSSDQNNVQIQRPSHKLAFEITGAKSAGEVAITEALTDAALVYMTLKLSGAQSLPLWTRLTLKELMNLAVILGEDVEITGTDAATAYNIKFAVPIADNAALQLNADLYAELSVVNGASSFTIVCSTVAHRRKSGAPLVIERKQMASGETKVFDLVNEAQKVVFPIDATSVDIQSQQYSSSLDGTDLRDKARNQKYFRNVSTGVHTMASMAGFTAAKFHPDIHDQIQSFTVTAGSSSAAFIIY